VVVKVSLLYPFLKIYVLCGRLEVQQHTSTKFKGGILQVE